MDRRERANDLTDSLIAAMRGKQSEMWTALPGIVQSFDPVEKTCSVQPSIQCRVLNPKTGEKRWEQLPILGDCPVWFPSGGGCTMTFPIAKGDECLVIFSSRCIDGWWQDGGVQPQTILRMHDLSDGFVLVGLSSLKNVPANISTTSVELRSNDGQAIIQLKPSDHSVTIVAPGKLKITGDVEVTGKITASGDVIGQGTSLHTHVHKDTTPGFGNTGVPV